jgi:hypothetical protein
MKERKEKDNHGVGFGGRLQQTETILSDPSPMLLSMEVSVWHVGF